MRTIACAGFCVQGMACNLLGGGGGGGGGGEHWLNYLSLYTVQGSLMVLSAIPGHLWMAKVVHGCMHYIISILLQHPIEESHYHLDVKEVGTCWDAPN